jgi:hypothetical protein
LAIKHDVVPLVGADVFQQREIDSIADRVAISAGVLLTPQLELSGWAPWRLLERGTEWILEPKTELLALLSGVRRAPL